MRSKQDITGIWIKLFPRFASSSTTLQGRIKEMLVHSILAGLVPAGAKFPPSRSLASALGVSRNSVSLALQLLVDKGFLIARARSGLFVNGEMLQNLAAAPPERAAALPELDWNARVVLPLVGQRNISKPANWHEYPYPFIYGQFDPSLMPLKDWRDCTQQAMRTSAARRWSQDFIDRDYAGLIEQIQHRLLPARGIVARSDEILLTAGAQMACHLLSNLLLGQDTMVGIENPGYPDARNNFKLRSNRVLPLPIDAHGLMASRSFGQCAYVYVTPSHQCPTTVTMPLARRQQLLELARRKDVVLFEDDHESELNFARQPLPALKSLDTTGRVIYMGSLSKTLPLGLRLGFIVAPAELIAALRALRRLMLRHVSANQAHTAGLFIAQGHHDALIRKLNLAYRERRSVLETAFAQHMPGLVITPSLGGSAMWVQPSASNASAKASPRNAAQLAALCAQRGVLIEPGDVFFETSSAASRASFRMGYSAVPTAMIEPGVRALRAACDELNYF